MGGDVRYEIGQNAYIKLVLHALKHKTSTVNAVLIGSFLPDAPQPTVEISDSVPLFHSQIGLLPLLEFALNMIEDLYHAQGLSIVGYFHANERFDDLELSNIARNIGDHIRSDFPHAAVLLLDNKKLEALSDGKDKSPVLQECLVWSKTWGSFGMKLYTKDAQKNWKQVQSDIGRRLSTKEPLSNVALSDYIASQKWEEIVDFDDHILDISKDWLNPKLFK